jgi:orotate phosphoribosyltransferase
MVDHVATETLRHISSVVALQLWDLGAIRVDLSKPFQLTSGNYSPLYVNCRQLISSPGFVELFSAAARMLRDTLRLRFDVVAGGETAGIPFAAFLARSFGCPMIYVRKGSKSHGLESRVEGILTNSARVLLVEDLITDAGSKLSFIEGIAAAGGVVEDAMVVFDRLQGGRAALEARGIRLHAVTDLHVALMVAEETQLLSAHHIEAVRDYLSAPREWHEKHGLPFKD